MRIAFAIFDLLIRIWRLHQFWCINRLLYYLHHIVRRQYLLNGQTRLRLCCNRIELSNVFISFETKPRQRNLRFPENPEYDYVTIVNQEPPYFIPFTATSNMSHAARLYTSMLYRNMTGVDRWFWVLQSIKVDLSCCRPPEDESFTASCFQYNRIEY